MRLWELKYYKKIALTGGACGRVAGKMMLIWERSTETGEWIFKYKLHLLHNFAQDWH